MSNKTNIKETIQILNKFKTIKILHSNTFIMHIESLEKIQQAIENILADRERLEKEKEIHIKLEQQYKKEYLDEKAKYDSLVEKIKKKKRYFEEWDELIATSDRNYSDGIVIQRFIDTFQELLDTD